MDYVLMLDNKGFCTPYDVRQQHFLSWEYLFNVLKPKQAFDDFKADLRFKLSTVAGIVFEPNNTPIISRGNTHYLNTFKSYSPTTNNQQQADLTPLNAFFERLFPIESEREIVLNWISHLIQRPYEKPTFHLMLTGEQGIGKGVLANNVIAPMISYQLASVNSFSQVTSRFSDLLASNLLIVFDDCRKGNHNTSTQLKSLLTEKRILIERKGLQSKPETTYSRFVLNSNDTLPIPIEHNDRRWYIPKYMEHQTNRQETQQFISLFVEWLESNIDNVYLYFMDRDITNFNPNDCLNTATKESLQEKSMPALVDYLNDYINDIYPYFTMSDIGNYLKRHSVSYTQEDLKTALDAIGYESKQVRGKNIIGKPRLCVPVGIDTTTITYPESSIF